MSVITLQIAHKHAPSADSFECVILKKRKFIASQNIFTVSDISFIKPNWHHDNILCSQMFPEFFVDYAQYCANRIDRWLNRDNDEYFFKKYPFMRAHNLLDGNPSHVTILTAFYPDLQVEEIQLEGVAQNYLVPVMRWPSITIKSLDQTEETLYFFSMQEAEAALNLILEGINNG